MKKSHKAVNRCSPATAGLLIGVYLRSQELHVVIDKYLSKTSLTENEKYWADGQQTELLLNQITAREAFQKIQTTKWEALPEHLKQVFKLAAVGNDEQAIAVSCNLSSKVAASALNASRGEADYIGRKIRRVLNPQGGSNLAAAVLENAKQRKGCNPRLHFHGVFRVSEKDLTQVKSKLEKSFAADYKEVAGNRSVVIKRIYDAGRWAGYCSKSLRKRDSGIGKAVYSTIPASRAGEQLFKQTTQWVRQLPSIEECRAKLNGLTKPEIKCNPCPELNMLINKHREQKEIIRRSRRQRHRSYVAQLISNPDLFKRQLIGMFNAISKKISL